MATWLRALLRVGLAVFLAVAGVGHFVATDAFLAQVPSWMPLARPVVWVSGAIELALAAALLLARPAAARARVGRAVAAFLLLVFPGNIAQALEGTAAFGLDTPAARWTRLALQPVLIAWALSATDAWPRRGAAARGRAAR